MERSTLQNFFLYKHFEVKRTRTHSIIITLRFIDFWMNFVQQKKNCELFQKLRRLSVVSVTRACDLD